MLRRHIYFRSRDFAYVRRKKLCTIHDKGVHDNAAVGGFSAHAVLQIHRAELLFRRRDFFLCHSPAGQAEKRQRRNSCRRLRRDMRRTERRSFISPGRLCAFGAFVRRAFTQEQIFFGSRLCQLYCRLRIDRLLAQSISRRCGRSCCRCGISAFARRIFFFSQRKGQSPRSRLYKKRQQPCADTPPRRSVAGDNRAFGLCGHGSAHPCPST